MDAADAAVAVEGASGEDATFRAAAARELFEETGVLLARGPTPEKAALREARAALLRGGRRFADLLAGLGLTRTPWTSPRRDAG